MAKSKNTELEKSDSLEITEPKAKPAPAAVDPNAIVSTKARRRRRPGGDGQVPLRTFVRACAHKDDQLAGFKTWCAKNGHTKHSMKEWAAVFDTFMKTPAGSN